jgi:hypothetical protein
LHTNSATVGSQLGDLAADGSPEETGSTVCLVGDQFSGMATVPGVHTLSQLVRDLHGGASVPRNIILGQGLQEYELEYLRAALSRREQDPRDVVVRFSDGHRVTRSLVHKHREQNVLLANLRKVADQRFEAGMVLHGENELLLDHQTGQHVQGMVVTEALRQMFIAVFEDEHGSRHPDRHFFVVWNSISLTFDSFLFPLPAEIICEILEQDVTDPTRMTFRVAMHIEQLGTSAAHAEIEFAAFDDARMKRSEKRKATSTVATLIQRFAHQKATVPTTKKGW